MGQLFQDLRYAFRQLRRAPTFTAVAVLTLALGIGANSAIFSVAQAVLLRALPFREPERLVQIGHQHTEQGTVFGAYSPQDYADLAADHGAFSSVAAYWFSPGSGGQNLTGIGEPVHVEAAMVSGNLFSTLGADAARGRTFEAAEDTPGANRVVVLSDRFWRDRLGSTRDAVGSTVHLDGVPYTVLGVMPPSFTFPGSEAEMWLPISLITDDMIPHQRGIRWLNLVGRLGPGISLSTATARSSEVVHRLESDFPASNNGWSRAALLPLREYLIGDVRPALVALLIAVGLVLLIACVNVAHLAVTRANLRGPEIAIRAALGASRQRLLRQLLAESAVLAFAGGALGLLLAVWVVPLLIARAGAVLPRAAEVRIDPAVLGFTLVVSVLAFLLVGLLPAIRAANAAVQPSLREGKSGAAGGARLAGGLLTAESALAVLLLSGAALTLTSLWKLTHVDPGFRPEGVVSFRVQLQGGAYEGMERQARFRAALLERIRLVPGVSAVGGSKRAPLTGAGEPYSFTVTRSDGSVQEAKPAGGFQIITPGYFEALGVPLLGGREFTPADTLRPFPIIINQELARRIWPGQEAVGQRIMMGTYVGTVIGLAGDVHHEGLATSAAPAAYVPEQFFPRSTLNVFARVRGDPLAMLAPIRAAVAELDPQLPVTDLGPLPTQLAETVAQPRFFTLLLGLFGATALVLAAIGVYGVVANSVARRRREIGIRMALGAEQRIVVRMVVGEALRWIVAGSAIGLVTFLASARVMRGLLYGVAPSDPLVLAAGALGLMLAGLAAAYIPARHASRIDPMAALRAE